MCPQYPRHLVLLSPALHAKACNLFPYSCNVLTKGSNCHGPFYSRGFWSIENLYWRNRVSYVISPFKIICYFKRSVFLKSPSNGLSFQGMQRRLSAPVLLASGSTDGRSAYAEGIPKGYWRAELVMGRSADSTVNRLIYDLTKIFLQNRSVNHLALPVDGGRGAFICLIYFQDAEMPAYP